ncbi:RNA-dependent RNA polymerase [Striga asiatica]|uniref:RNA-dependent RNA polymerase n=1 Tax=Striga asiatica TaxID=4170 RepID=A0A5A7QKV6_STRAF|nr:RNA-dependent RNA polymerase [Striga asiatica]
MVLIQRLKVDPKEALKVRSCCTSFPFEGWQSLMQFVHAVGKQWSQGAFWPLGLVMLGISGTSLSPNWIFFWFEDCIGPYLPSPDDLGVMPITGRLASSLEGSGKRRIFAIGNYINQRVLRPAHVWMASVLKRIPNDGTFAQLAPLVRLKSSMDTFLYDLSAATDRWPLLVLFKMFQYLFDRSFASSSTLSTQL